MHAAIAIGAKARRMRFSSLRKRYAFVARESRFTLFRVIRVKHPLTEPHPAVHADAPA
jgi:hypothetical protein